jgi:hypothetical protein
MLFDLRSRGRRRLVQVVYLSLAILMGGGLVLFGIGGDVQGGLFDAFREESGQDSGTDVIQERLQQAEAAARRNPRQPEAWAALTRERYRAAASGEGFDQNTRQFTAQGRERLRSAAQAWERYLALDPPRVDDRVAALMVEAYSPAGLNRPRDAVEALEVLIERRGPSSDLFSRLAILNFQAGQERQGDLAVDRAVELAEPDERRALRRELQELKTQIQQGAAQGGQGAR